MIKRPKIEIVDVAHTYWPKDISIIGLGVVVPTKNERLQYFVCNPENKLNPGLDAGVLIKTSYGIYFVLEDFSIYHINCYYINNSAIKEPVYINNRGALAVYELAPTHSDYHERVSQKYFNYVKVEVGKYLRKLTK